MHEYPVTVRIVEIAEETAEKRKAKVRRIDLVVGKDSGFIGESIQMYFDIVAEGTRCEGAKLFIEGVEPRLRCTQCGELFVRRLYSFACPSCGGEGEPTAIGKEFYIKSKKLIQQAQKKQIQQAEKKSIQQTPKKQMPQAEMRKHRLVLTEGKKICT